MSFGTWGVDQSGDVGERRRIGAETGPRREDSGRSWEGAGVPRGGGRGSESVVV